MRVLGCILLAAAALLAAIVVSCASPDYGAGGFRCALDRRCPSGYECQSDDRCRRPTSASDLGDVDASVDDVGGADVLAPSDLANCGWGSYPAYFDACWAPDADLGSLSASDDARFTTSDAGSLQILWLDRLQVATEAQLVVDGPSPLLIAAREVVIAGRLVTRAGARQSDGAIATLAGGCGGGGQGGRFASTTPAGGVGADCLVGTPVPAACAAPFPFAGGCPGAVGEGAGGATGGAGGAGGGSLLISARQRLIVTGHVLAPGQGGQGGVMTVNTGTCDSSAISGGGGGGGGGRLFLEAPEILLLGGGVCATGGYGGGGGTTADPPGQRAGNGADGDCGDHPVATGGTAGGYGGRVDAGGAGNDGQPNPSCLGGGGGGGGPGSVTIRAQQLVVDGGVIAPPP